VHRAQTDRLQVARNLLVELARRRRFVLHDLGDHHVGAAAKRALARKQLVKYSPKAVDIRAGIDLVAMPRRLLRAHIDGRAKDLALQGHRLLRLAVQSQAKVGDLGNQGQGTSARGRGRRSLSCGPRTPDPFEQNVTWVDIAMDNAAAVGIIHGIGHSSNQPSNFAIAEALLLEMARECRSVDELADQIG
jgi:hypothetical protein